MSASSGLSFSSRSLTSLKIRPRAAKSVPRGEVDQVLAHAAHVGGRRLDQLAPALVGHHRLDAAAVGLGSAWRRTRSAFSIRATVCVTRLREWDIASASSRHPHPAAVGLGEADQDLVLAERDLVLLAQLAVELMLQQLGAHDVGAP